MTFKQQIQSQIQKAYKESPYTSCNQVLDAVAEKTGSNTNSRITAYLNGKSEWLRIDTIEILHDLFSMDEIILKKDA